MPETEVPLFRLYLIRAACILFIVSGFAKYLPTILHPDPANRGLIASMLAGLWLCAFLAFRYPLRMLPLLLFELVWKALWLVDYGLPQYLSGTGTPRLGQDMIEIGLWPFLFALIMPWPYFWRRYVRQPAEPWW